MKPEALARLRAIMRVEPSKVTPAGVTVTPETPTVTPVTPVAPNFDEGGNANSPLVDQRVTLENQIRGLAVVFGVRLPRALTAAFVDQALKASEGWLVFPPPCGD